MSRRSRIGLVAVVVGVLAVTTAARDSSERRVGAAGVSVALPSGWHDIPQMVLPASMKTGDPVTRVVVASAAIDFGGKGCNDFVYTFSRKAVAIVIVEWARPTPGRFPGRPRHFTQSNLPVRSPPALECWNGPGGGAQFVDHGRRFAAYILRGRDARAAVDDRARRVLDTLAVK